MDQVDVDLKGVPETLLIPLYCRAVESRRRDALVKDELAVELMNRIDYDFSRLKLSSADMLFTIMRVREFDRCTQTFLAAQPDGVVVSLGCGLDTRFHRVDNGTVTWYDLDLPEVMVVRHKLLAEGAPRNRFIACSALDPAWMDGMGNTAPGYLFLAEGVLPYLAESQAKALVLALTERFPGAELVTDAMSPFMVRVHNWQLAATGLGARLHWGLRRDRDVETWAPGGAQRSAGIRLLSRWTYFDQPEPRLGAARLMRFVPRLAGAARIVRYRLGEPAQARRE